MPQIGICPSCQRKLLVPDELQGKSVRCPTCEAVFTAQADAVGDPERRLPAGELQGSEHVRSEPERPPHSGEDREPPRRHREDEDDDDYYDGPGYGRSYGRWSRQAALSAVSSPGTALQIVSGIAIATNLILLLLALAGVALPFAMGGQGPRNQNDQVFLIAEGITSVGVRVLGIVLCILIAYGANKMKRLESRKWAMASAIMAIIPCTGCCVLTMPFGIWALVVINKPEVRDYMQ